MKKTDQKSPITNLFIAVALLACMATAGLYLIRARSCGAERIEPPAPAPYSPAGDGGEALGEERWQGIYQGRQKIGWAFSRIRRTAEGFDLWAKSRIKIKLLDQAQEISLILQGKLDPDYAIREIEFQGLFAATEIKARGIREGDLLKLEIDMAGEKRNHEIKLDKAPTLEMHWALRERMKTAKVGDEFILSIFEPMTSKSIDVLVKVAGEEEVELDGEPVDCFKTEVTMLNQSQWSWFRKSDGELIKEYHPATGFTTILEDKETALEVDWKDIGGVDLIGALMVASSKPIRDPRGVTHFKAGLVGAPLDGLDTEAPGRQTLSGDTVTIDIESALPAEGYALPIGKSLPETAAEFSKWLKPSLYIESDHKKIGAASDEAVAGAADAMAAVDNLLDWVSREMTPSMTRSFPSALEVLDKKRGACTEHAVLFVALARAAGIPARPVSGVVYSNEMMLEGFYYHAWAEVYLAGPEGVGAWVAVDPTFHQVPADATHVRLIEGGRDQMRRIGAVMGKLRVEVEEVR